jgi:hypothetical protein
LNILFEEKKFEILSIKHKNKSSNAISFVDEDFVGSGKKNKHIEANNLNSSSDDFATDILES